MSKFTDRFSTYDLPALTNGVRLPEFHPSDEQFKDIGLPNTATNKEFITQLCRIGYKKFISNKIDKKLQPLYAARFKEEIALIDELNFIDYLLMVYDITNFCHKNNILIGPSRGSVGSSLVCMLMGITRIDPILHGTFFARFLSKARAKSKIINGVKYIDGSLVLDVDIDINYYRREEVISYLNAKYSGRTCKLLTVGTLTSKILLKDVLKIYEEANEDEANYVSDLVEKTYGIPQEIFDSLSNDAEKGNEKFKEWAKDHGEVVKIAQQLSGLTRSFGQHASALAICHDKIDELIPLQLSATNESISSFDMYSAQEISLKFDLLGLKTLSILDGVSKRTGINLEDIDINDQVIYDYLQNPQYLYGIFQYESHSQGEIARKIKPKCFKQIVDSLAISRPGAVQFLGQYLDYIHKGIYKTIHPLIDPVLKETGGVALFQESLLKMINNLGMDLEECEGLRKAVAKKLPEKVKEYKDKIYKVCEINNHPKEVADLIWSIADASSGYSFSLCHSVGYSMITCQTVYFKAKYPLEFYVECLRMARNEADSQECIAAIQCEMRQQGLSLLPPDILQSEEDFSIVKGTAILTGLKAIKGISDKIIEKLRLYKKQNSTKFDIFNSAAAASLPINVMRALIMSGCINSGNITRSRLVLELELYNILTDKERNYIAVYAAKYNNDLCKMIKECNSSIIDTKGHKLIKDSRFETIKKKFAPFKEKYLKNSRHEELCAYIMENEYLGFSYSTTLKNIYSKHCNDLKTIYEISGELNDVKVRLVANVVKVEKKVSKAKKTPYLRILCKDETGETTCMLFNQQRIDQTNQFNGKEVESGDIVILNCMKKDSNSLFVDTLSIQDSPIIIKLSDLMKSIKL